MRANPEDSNDAVSKAHFNEKTMVVALDIEDNAVVLQEVDAPKIRLDVLRSLPLSRLDEAYPGIEGPFGACVPLLVSVASFYEATFESGESRKNDLLFRNFLNRQSTRSWL